MATLVGKKIVTLKDLTIAGHAVAAGSIVQILTDQYIGPMTGQKTLGTVGNNLTVVFGIDNSGANGVQISQAFAIDTFGLYFADTAIDAAITKIN